MGVDRFLGKNLLNRIEEIFYKNKITPSVALTEIQKI